MKKLLTKILTKFRYLFSIDHDRQRKGIQATKHGMFNNFVYALKTTWKLNRRFLIFIMIGSVALALYTLAGVYLPKIALELVSGGVSTKEIITTMVIVGIIILIIALVKQYADVIGSYEFDKVQYQLMGKYLRKAFTTDFCNMENPEFLDLTERAVRANYYNVGFHGYCMRAKYVLSDSVLVIIAGAAIAVINPLLVVVLAAISYVIYKIFDDTMEWDKVNVNDALASNYRKHYYFANTAKDFKYAKDIRLFKMADWIENVWNDVNAAYYLVVKKGHNKWIACEAKMSFFRLIQNVILYAVLIYMIFNKGMSIADFVMYIGLVASFSETMTDLFSNLVWMNMNKLQMDDYRTFIDWVESQPDKENGEGMETNIDLGKYEFEFRNVSFKYPGHDNYVLKNVNLKINAGTKLAIVGVNGAGKTTLTKLLMRLYEPTEGTILLNGVDVKKYDRNTYHKIFAPVFQNVEMFAFPIWQNVSMKRPEETDRNKVEAALKKSGLNEKIDRYESGIDTQLLKIFDQNGIDLSGGERQRMAMARALYQERNVLVLDEPTAALDALAEDKMYQEFNNMVQGKTSLFISHRLSSTRFCDKIVLFEDGQVVEEGSHDELMNQNGKYAEMFEIQAQYYVDSEGNNDNSLDGNLEEGDKNEKA